MPARFTPATATAGNRVAWTPVPRDHESSPATTCGARRSRWIADGTRSCTRPFGGVRTLLLLLLLGLTALGCRPTTPASNDGATAVPNGSVVAGKDDSRASAPEEPLRVLVIDDGELGQVIARQWRAHTQQELQILEARSTALDAKIADADVLVFPSALMGQMVVNRWIMPWPRPWQPAATRRGSADLGGAGTNADAASEASGADEDYRWNDVLPFLRRQELRWGEQLYGVSFGSPSLMLLYRQDLLQAWGLEPPRTWTDYLALLPRIEERLKAARAAVERGEPAGIAGPVPSHASLLPLTPGWAARCLLAWAAPYARHPNQYSTFFQFVTMEPLIARPPFERALQEMLEAARYAPEEAWTQSPDDVMRQFLAGNAVLAWSWPSPAHGAPDLNGTGAGSTGAGDQGAAQAFSFGLRSLPGSMAVYNMSESRWEDRSAPGEVPLFGVAGRVGAVARRSRSPEASCNLLLWLTSAEQATRVATKSSATTAARLSHLSSSAELWMDPPLATLAPQFAAAMQASQQSADAIMVPRIPGEIRYLDALDLAIRQARVGNTSAAAALQQAAEEWQRITEDLGKDAQRQAYAESLGLTAP